MAKEMKMPKGMHKVQPQEPGKSPGPMAVESDSKAPIYPTIRVPLEHMPEAKKFDIGDMKNICIQCKVVGVSNSRFQKEVELELHGIMVESAGEEKAEDEE